MSFLENLKKAITVLLFKTKYTLAYAFLKKCNLNYSLSDAIVYEEEKYRATMDEISAFAEALNSAIAQLTTPFISLVESFKKLCEIYDTAVKHKKTYKPIKKISGKTFILSRKLHKPFKIRSTCE